MLALAAPPESLGRYRIVAEVARGTTSVVYLAVTRDPADKGQLFALKQLRPAFAEDPALVAQFIAEARLGARFTHANVARTLEVDEVEDLPYIAMKYLDGQPLQRVVAFARKAGDPLSVGMHLAILGGALEGLGYTHAVALPDGSPLQFVHRDVGPHNVFVTCDGEPTVLDFGVSQVVDSSSDAPLGAFRARIAYMSPELAAGRHVDARSDLFGIGVMMWEAVTGQRFWAQAQSERQILQSLASQELPAARHEALAGVAPDLRAVIVRAIEADPADRYESAAAYQRDLQAVLAVLEPHGFDRRALGQRVTDLFADERARLEASIEEARERAQDAPRSRARTSVTPPPLPVAPTPPVPAVAPTPAPARATMPLPSPLPPPTSSYPPKRISLPPPPAPARVPAPGVRSERTRRELPWMAAGLGAIVLLAGFALFRTRDAGDAPGAEAPPRGATVRMPATQESAVAEEPAPEPVAAPSVPSVLAVVAAPTTPIAPVARSTPLAPTAKGPASGAPVSGAPVSGAPVVPSATPTAHAHALFASTPVATPAPPPSPAPPVASGRPSRPIDNVNPYP